MLMNINLTISKLNVNNQIIKFSSNTAAKVIYVTLTGICVGLSTCYVLYKPSIHILIK